MFKKIKEFTKEELISQLATGVIGYDFFINYTIKRDKVYNKLIDRVNELEEINEEHRKLNGELREENKALKKEIEMCDKKIDNLRLSRDKAIEYIKPKFVEQGGFTSYEWNDLLNDLLEILKGGNNE